MRVVRLALIGMLTSAALACDDRTLSGPAQDDTPANVAGAERTYTLSVRIRSEEGAPASVQGAVRFRAGGLESSLETPAGENGTMYVANPAELGSGRIRFAALTPSQFAAAADSAGAEILRFTVKASSLAGLDLSAAIEQAGDSTGAVMAGGQVRAFVVVVDSALAR